MCASSELQFGGLREGGGTREAGSTVAESLVVLCLSGGYAPDSAKAEGGSIRFALSILAHRGSALP